MTRARRRPIRPWPSSSPGKVTRRPASSPTRTTATPATGSIAASPATRTSARTRPSRRSKSVRSTSLGKCLLRLMGYSMSFAPGDHRFAEDRGHDQSRRPRVDLEPPGQPAVLPVPQLLRRPCPVRPARGRDPAFRPVRAAPRRADRDPEEGRSGRSGRIGRERRGTSPARRAGQRHPARRLREQHRLSRRADRPPLRRAPEPGAAREHAGDRHLRPRRALPGARLLGARHERLPARDPRAAPDLPPAGRRRTGASSPNP